MDNDEKYWVFNVTDQIYASLEPMTKAEAEGFIKAFPARYNRQGYYKTVDGDRIPPDQVVLELRGGGKPPYSIFMSTDGYKMHWSEEQKVWFTGKSWDDRDMTFYPGPTGWPVTEWYEDIDGDYIEEAE